MTKWLEAFKMLYFMYVLEENIYLELRPLGSLAVVQLVAYHFAIVCSKCIYLIDVAPSLPNTPLRIGDI